jgi:hypothetical protein
LCHQYFSVKRTWGNYAIRDLPAALPHFEALRVIIGELFSCKTVVENMCCTNLLFPVAGGTQYLSSSLDLLGSHEKRDLAVFSSGYLLY